RTKEDTKQYRSYIMKLINSMEYKSLDDNMTKEAEEKAREEWDNMSQEQKDALFPISKRGNGSSEIQRYIAKLTRTSGYRNLSDNEKKEAISKAREEWDNMSTEEKKAKLEKSTYRNSSITNDDTLYMVQNTAESTDTEINDNAIATILSEEENYDYSPYYTHEPIENDAVSSVYESIKDANTLLETIGIRSAAKEANRRINNTFNKHGMFTYRDTRGDM